MISVRYNQLFTTLTMLCILLRFYLFKNVSNTSSLIAKEIKTNINLISIKLFIVHTILCATVSNLNRIRQILCFWKML